MNLFFLFYFKRPYHSPSRLNYIFKIMTQNLVTRLLLFDHDPNPFMTINYLTGSIHFWVMILAYMNDPYQQDTTLSQTDK